MGTIGFQQIINVDEQLLTSSDSSRQQSKAQRREDLQILDRDTKIVIEVKGVFGHVGEDDALAVTKYVSARLKQWRPSDVHGIGIFNHQRRLPPLERDNTSTFSPDILTTAEDQQFALMTTWDLYRLARSYIKNKWLHRWVSDLFYRAGRIIPISLHYVLIGIVEDHWTRNSAIGFLLEGDNLRTGNRISLEFVFEYEEFTVESIRIDERSVEVANVGEHVGVKIAL